MKKRTPKFATRKIAFAALEPLRVKLESGSVTYTELLGYLTMRLQLKIHRPNIIKWFEGGKDRVEPSYGIGLLLENFNALADERDKVGRKGVSTVQK
jgi:intein-encoded DNA endonuclease-like protein